MKKCKKALQLLAFLLVFTFIFQLVPVVSLAENTENSKELTNSASIPMVYRDLTGNELTTEMGAGWNLGNTMDGHTGFTPGETVWQGVKTTKELIKSVHDLGFNTIRIPVTWGTMIDDENNYAINEAWISRVQDMVDYCVSLDMYVIINIHHDGAEQEGWLRIATENQKSLRDKYEGVWKNISERFKDYDEHLIFESMNEVKGSGMSTLEENQVIMELNQVFVDTIRATGSNNEKRWLVVTGKYNYIDSVCNEINEFELPKDTIENRLIVSVHDYTTWGFCGQEDTSVTEYPLSKMQSNRLELQPLYETYTSKGIPVIVGEYGCINKGNPAERAYYLEGMNRIFQEFGLVGIYWDQGWFDRTLEPDYSFSIIDRMTGEPIEKEVTDAMMRGFFVKGDSNLSDITKSPEINKISNIELSEEQVNIKVGDSIQINSKVQPENTNDVLLWKSADETIATVAYGKIHGKAKGTTTISAFSQSGSLEKTIEVQVEDRISEVSCEEIITEDSYQLVEEEYVYINASMLPEETDENLYYKSRDESVATVSPIGKILAVGNGSAVIEVCSTGGIKKEVAVEVTGVTQQHEIKLSLNVYYNDATHNYFGNETSSDVITVTGNGEYSLVFDCSKDLSKEAVEKGVDQLKDLTAIYIKDYQVVNGEETVSPLQSCDITYDKIFVNGNELTLTSKDTKSALKESGIFDSNDPINSWDGSLVEEIKESDNAINFTTVKEPTTIKIVFHLSNMVFSDGTIAGDVIKEGNTEVEKEISEKGVQDKQVFSYWMIGILIICFIVTLMFFLIRKNKKGIKHDNEKK